MQSMNKTGSIKAGQEKEGKNKGKQMGGQKKIKQKHEKQAHSNGAKPANQFRQSTRAALHAHRISLSASPIQRTLSMWRLI